MKRPLNDLYISQIKLALQRGYKQHDIAAIFGINQGRVSEINTGKCGANIPMAHTIPPALILYCEQQMH
ncbi:hypothetical protein [Bartonella sp. DGB2]|uniref:hypothetical protein n=1 Tax=Bartonella sp. DGB2 TaxID=3388426 RepID=UPI00398FEE78